MNKILNLLIIFTIFIISSSCTFAKDLKIVQFSDLHFNNSPESVENYKKIITEINSIEDVDFVVSTGDNIDKPNSEYLKQFLLMSRKFKRPFYLQIGNHDVSKTSKFSKEEYINYIRKYSKYKFFKDFNYVVKKDGLVFIFLDGTKEYIPAPNGFYKDETLNFLDKNLKKYKNKKVIIFQHYPLIKKTENSNQNLFKSDDYFSVLANHDNVIAVISGHYHIYKYDKINDVQHYVSSSASERHEKSYQIIFIEYLGNNNYDIIFSPQSVNEN